MEGEGLPRLLLGVWGKAGKRNPPLLVRVKHCGRASAIGQDLQAGGTCSFSLRPLPGSPRDSPWQTLLGFWLAGGVEM